MNYNFYIKIIFLLFLVSISLIAENLDSKNVITISLKKVLSDAIEKNENYQLSILDNKKSTFNTKSNEGRFDTVFSTNLEKSIDKTLDKYQENYTLALNKQIFFGTEFELSKTVSTTTYQNSSTSDISASEVKLKVTQPLLKNFGTKNQLIDIEKSKLKQIDSEFYKKNELSKVVYNTSILFLNSLKSINNYEVSLKSLKFSEELFTKKLEETKIGGFPKAYLYEIEADLMKKKIDSLNAKKNMNNSLIELFKELHLEYRPENNYNLAFDLNSIKEFEFEEMSNSALAKRYDYNLIKTLERISKLDLAYRDNQKLPEFNIYGSLIKNDYGNQDENYNNEDNNKNSYEFGFNFSYPLFNTTAKANYQTQKIEKMKLSIQKEQKKREIRKEIKVALNDIKIQKEILTTYKKLFEKEKRTLDIEKIKLENGLSSVRDLISVQDSFITSELNLLISKIEYQKNIAKLYYIIREVPIKFEDG